MRKRPVSISTNHELPDLESALVCLAKVRKSRHFAHATLQVSATYPTVHLEVYYVFQSV